MNETEKKIDPAQKESDQVVQRRANFDALKALGVDPYPHEFERTHGVRELVAKYGARTGEELLVSSRFAGLLDPSGTRSVGQYELKGFDAPVELFTLRPSRRTRQHPE